MQTGDKDNFYLRLQQTLPRWWGDLATAPIVSAILQGVSAAFVQVWDYLAYARLQTRIKTATNGWLDLIALDFFGTRIQRQAYQNDASFRSTILRELFRIRATRQAVINVLTDLTGRTPVIIEPTHPADTGAYGVSTSGYGVAGYYGSLLLPYQAFVIAYRPHGQGAPGIAGYGCPQGAYTTPSAAEYVPADNLFSSAPDAAIYAAVESVKPEATAVWVSIQP